LANLETNAHTLLYTLDEAIAESSASLNTLSMKPAPESGDADLDVDIETPVTVAQLEKLKGEGEKFYADARKMLDESNWPGVEWASDEVEERWHKKMDDGVSKVVSCWNGMSKAIEDTIEMLQDLDERYWKLDAIWSIQSPSTTAMIRINMSLGNMDRVGWSIAAAEKMQTQLKDYSAACRTAWSDIHGIIHNKPGCGITIGGSNVVLNSDRGICAVTEDDVDLLISERERDENEVVTER
jgi:hypothetical protein